MWAIWIFGACAVTNAFATVIPENVHSSYVNLEFGKEYTSTELQHLHHEHKRNSGPLIKRYDQPPMNHGTLPVTSPTTSIIFLSHCPTVGGDNLQFLATAVYDGKDVTFTSKQNIDKFDQVNTFGKGTNTILAETKIHHAACRSPATNVVCSYFYVGTMYASVRLSPKQNLIDVSVYPTDGNGHSAPVISETCHTFGPREKHVCPPDSGRRCNYEKVITNSNP